MCLKLPKALHGCLKSAMLWCNTLREFLEAEGFVVNLCGICVANKKVNGKQFTIAWHVDDLKLSHVDLNIIKKFIGKMESKFGELHKTFGDVHKSSGHAI